MLEITDENINSVDLSTVTSISAHDISSRNLTVLLDILSVLCNIESLKIRVSYDFVLPILLNITELDCSYCFGLTKIPMFSTLTHLDCTFCDKLVTIPMFPNLVELSCSHCKQLTSIPMLSNLHSLTCRKCEQLTHIPSLPNLLMLDITMCVRLIEIPTLPNIQYIKYNGCNQLDKYTLPLRSIKPTDWDIPNIHLYIIHDPANADYLERILDKAKNILNDSQIQSISDVLISSRLVKPVYQG